MCLTVMSAAGGKLLDPVLLGLHFLKQHMVCILDRLLGTDKVRDVAIGGVVEEQVIVRSILDPEHCRSSARATNR